MTNQIIEETVANLANYFDWDGESEQAHEIYKALLEADQSGYRRAMGEAREKLGFMRQWLNEDRITDASRMVSTEQLAHWLFPPHR